MVRPIGVIFDLYSGEYKPVLLKSQVIKSLIEIDNYSYERANDFWNRCMMMNSEITAVDDMLSQEEIHNLIF